MNGICHCGAVVEQVDAAFCEHCGARLTHTQVSKVGVPAPVLPFTDVGESLPHSARPTFATSCPIVAGAVGSETTPKAVNAVIGRLDLDLEINRQRLYVAQHRGVLDLRITNRSGGAFGEIVITVRGNMLGEPYKKALGQLGPGEHYRILAPVSPQACDAGENILEVFLEAERAEIAHVVKGQIILPVLAEPSPGPGPSIDLRDWFKGAGDVMGVVLELGGLADVLASSRVRTVNELLVEIDKLTAQYEVLPLHLDREASEVLRHQREAPKRLRGELGHARAPTTEATLEIHLPGGVRNVILLGTGRVTLGRQRAVNDVVIRAVGDDAGAHSLRIGRQHCTVSIGVEGVAVVDLGTRNGTALNGARLPPGEARTVPHSSRVNLGGAVDLKIDVFTRSWSPATFVSAFARDLNLPSTGMLVAPDVPIDSVRLRRLDGVRKEEEYLIVLAQAYIGCNPANAISLEVPQASPIAARLLYLGGRFWLESLSPTGTVRLGELALAEHDVIPLTYGTELMIDSIPMRFVPKRQIHMADHGDSQ
ncbi:MAG: FHA domain-containing protein [Phycisphaerales bacterium]|nr:FHA domain-containing protein [Phycisphaerales bacterium]